MAAATSRKAAARIRTQSDCYTSGERERAWRRSLADDLGLDETFRASLNGMTSSGGRLSLGASPGRTDRVDFGKLSDTAAEILSDAKLIRGGKEAKLYQQSLCLSDEDAKEALSMDVSNDADENSRVLQPLTPELVEWEGILSKRSEWLRRWEKHYYVMVGTTLKRFASKEAFMATLQESPVEGRPPPPSYVIQGVKEAPNRANGFVFSCHDGKTLQLTAPTPIERVIWMRLAQEAMASLPDLPVFPLEIEEFYAMLIVLYTAHSGNWRTSGDMAVTLPPPSEQVFSRFFRLLDRDILVSSNYPPSVPFCGSFRGASGFVQFLHTFASHTTWTNFKIEGIAMEDMVAVASGKEELENVRDRRKFVQNWVHKFNFAPDGRLIKFEINGDVVAASAVYKVPGAATTLTLPQDFQEVQTPLSGTLTVRVLQGSGLKLLQATSSSSTATARKTQSLQDPRVVLSLAIGDLTSTSHSQLPPTLLPAPSSAAAAATASLASLSSTASSYLPLPSTLTRKLSTSLLMRSVSAPLASSKPDSATADSTPTQPPKPYPCMTDAARNKGQFSTEGDLTAPVWNSVLTLPFDQVQGVIRLLVDVVEVSSSSSRAPTKVGAAFVNVAKYIMEQEAKRTTKSHNTNHTSSTSSSDHQQHTQWVTISTTRGEFCGRVQLTISCVLQPAEAAHKPTPAAQLMQWSNIKKDDNIAPSLNRPGWSQMSLNTDAGSSEKPSMDAVKSPDAAVNPLMPKQCDDDETMHVYTVCGAPFVIPQHYHLIKVCGRGAYGIVIAATNQETGGSVAIKKVIDCIWHPHQLKQILREVRLMRHLCHANILSLMDLIPPPSYQDFRDVYMTVDLLEMDLHRIIYSKEVLSDDHIRYFVFQMLSGLNHMHACGVLHRDLKPSNLLINSDCQLKICDMGLARPKDIDDLGMTEYVVTRWYRAPELLLGSAYDEGVDVWAAGCIMAEMLGRKPLFPGRSYVHQLQLIMNVLGVPEEVSFKENPQAQKFKGRQLLSRTPTRQGIDTSVLFPNANPEGLDLLWKLLVFDSSKRMTVQEALRHPYLASYYVESNDDREVEKFHSFDFEDLGENDLKELMFREICHFHPEEMEKRAKQMADMPKEEQLPPGWVKRESRSIRGKFYYSHAKRGISTWVKPTN
ncbi:CMGC/MAPK protein kinase, variant [Aphanomyces invadans]|uniref:CMGC/MAPK protein kinase, variant n=1 Tax=Aphanomyces invadans TaxID=157072 RepID=A0A024TLE3_9STRA|nr:CMGC/MAPK protein kinase, variant [Aphanomyces invadans]ETV94182.1 CMGC/MAPK protein kinase, variant [Aphanomyces invadans]|eukprot:XP_008877384.1 CMGC/MAPK protein kinase, variant [Aphanomyces invadans]